MARSTTAQHQAIPFTGSGQRAGVHPASWETYEKLLADLANPCHHRLTYDRGTLEIMSPFSED